MLTVKASCPVCSMHAIPPRHLHHGASFLPVDGLSLVIMPPPTVLLQQVRALSDQSAYKINVLTTQEAEADYLK